MTKKKQHLFNTYTLRTASKVAGLLKRKKCYSFQPVAIFASQPKHSPTPLLAVRTSGNFKTKTLCYQGYLEQTGLLSKECTWIRYDIITN